MRVRVAIDRVMKQKIGRILVAVFGLCLFLEVACLPALSSVAVKFDNSVLAELCELGEKEETIALNSILAFAFEDLKLLQLPTVLDEDLVHAPVADIAPQHEIPIYLEYHSLLI